MPTELQQRRARILMLARRAAGYSRQVDLAKAVSVSRSTVQNYEDAKYDSEPNRNLAYLVCRAVGLDPDAWIEGRYGDDLVHENRGPNLQAWLEEYGGWLSSLSAEQRREEIARVDSRRDYIDSREQAG